MSKERKIVIVTGRCSQSKAGFGIRFERHSSTHQWIATWAFPVKEAAAKREGYDKSQIGGSFAIEPTFPGCPHCQGKGFVKCGGCGKVACWNGESQTVTCPWCSQDGCLGGQVEILEAGGDG